MTTSVKKQNQKKHANMVDGQLLRIFKRPACARSIYFQFRNQLTYQEGSHGGKLGNYSVFCISRCEIEMQVNILTGFSLGYRNVKYNAKWPSTRNLPPCSP